VRIGVLALQGDVTEHWRALGDVGVEPSAVRRPEDLRHLDGIVLPGGESTTMSMLLDSSALREPLAEALHGGLPAFGTCAGLILLARTVIDGRPDQRSFGLVDMVVRRNGYGRQAQSFECDVPVEMLPGAPVHAVFIRAPVVESVGPLVRVLGSAGSVFGAASATGSATADRSGRVPAQGHEATPVVCLQGSVLVTAFHPELTGDRRLHRLFVAMVAEHASAGSGPGPVGGQDQPVVEAPGGRCTALGA
jgi:5'-phosphate synthase pdxT subunit